MSLGYEHIQISPYTLVNLELLTLTKKINEHTRLYFTGVIPEDMQDSYVESTGKNTVIARGVHFAGEITKDKLTKSVRQQLGIK
ncbi:hypothetical protein NSS79_18100 [Paenibacillus sp. FSL L8-0436]|uniref:hypothetical protein n=1 Tax=Paenibacillus sp. FSL L8-0436 TaxID=2954686 RepID=UPI0031589C2F